MPADTASSALTGIPNAGPAIARKPPRLDVRGIEDLRGRDPDELFERLCAMDGRRHDPCLLDTFTAAGAYADGGPVRPRRAVLLARGGAGAPVWCAPARAQAPPRRRPPLLPPRSGAARPRPAPGAARGGRTS